MPMTARVTNFAGGIISEKRGGTRQVFRHDAQGNTISVMSNDGTIIGTVDYWPYGEVRATTGTVTTPFKYCGFWGYYEGGHKLSYVRARYLNKSLGRWMTVDPLWPWQDAYLYATTNPMTEVDPSGLSACSHPCGADPCAYFRSNPPLDYPFIAAVMICCNGKAYVCFGPMASKDPGIRDCERVHEQYHVGVSSHKCKGVGYSDSVPVSDSEECGAFTAEINCYKDHMARECNRLTGQAKLDCVQKYRDAIEEACADAKAPPYSCPSSALPAICR